MSTPVRRVLMTADTVGGVWTYAVELAHGLAARGVSTALATMGAPLSPEQRREWATVPGGSLHESVFRLEWMDDAWRDVRRAGHWLIGLERATGPDIVHLNGYAHGALAWRRPVVVVGHSCVRSWWEGVHGTVPPPRYAPYAAAVNAGLRGADRIVAPSAAMLRALRRHYGTGIDGTVIHNGREVSMRRGAARKAPMVLAAGRLWDEAKNLRVLADAAPRLSWPVIVAGATRHPHGGTTTFRGVHHMGRLSSAALQGWMARAPIYASPARYEPFGLSVLEAALHGCALVLGDIDSLRELWDGAADFVPPDDARALARALDRLIGDPGYRRRMARAARVRAGTYTRERMADAYLDLYAQACTEGSAAARRFAGLPA